MTEQEFGQNFATMTTCMIRPEDETLRFKCEFLKDVSGQNRSVERGVRSKYQYEVQLNQKQKLDIVLHQEDIRILDVIRRRPYMSIGMSVFKQDP